MKWLAILALGAMAVSTGAEATVVVRAPVAHVQILKMPYWVSEQHGNWSWAASVQTVIDMMSPDSPVEQCEIVSKSAGTDCCMGTLTADGKKKCLQTVYDPRTALRLFNYYSDRTPDKTPLTWSQLVNQLGRRRAPVLIWPHAGRSSAHGMVAIGYAAIEAGAVEERYILVFDPWPLGAGSMRWELFSQYACGRWLGHCIDTGLDVYDINPNLDMSGSRQNVQSNTPIDVPVPADVVVTASKNPSTTPAADKAPDSLLPLAKFLLSLNALTSDPLADGTLDKPASWTVWDERRFSPFDIDNLRKRVIKTAGVTGDCYLAPVASYSMEICSLGAAWKFGGISSMSYEDAATSLPSGASISEVWYLDEIDLAMVNSASALSVVAEVEDSGTGHGLSRKAVLKTRDWYWTADQLLRLRPSMRWPEPAP
ncbi:MAG: hypothetical protein ACREHE_02535 [Rhizomicrobium sp.]